MERINIREARQRFSALVDAAEQGDLIVITRHGKEVARLGPVEGSSEAGLPDLSEFRASIGGATPEAGEPLSETVRQSRERTRY